MTNPDILLYMCDSANNQQAQRSRLFLHWFMPTVNRMNTTPVRRW